MPAGRDVGLFPRFAVLVVEGCGGLGTSAVIRHPLLVGLVLGAVCGLLVSTLPTWSFKNFRIPRAAILPLLLGVGFYVALLLAEPWAALAAGGFIYLGMLPFSLRSYLMLKQEAEGLIEQEQEATPGAP